MVFRDKFKLRRHVEMHDKEESFECKTCNFTFKKETIYEKHLEYHTGKRKHLCTTCFQAFGVKANFEKHLGTHGSQQNKPFSCQKCNKNFSVKHNLNYHTKMVHEGNRNFSCSACGRKVTTLQSLKGHEEKCGIKKKQMTQKLTEVLFEVKEEIK